MNKVLKLGVCALALLEGRLEAENIKHEFLATDESRDQLLYVNQFDPSKDWSVQLKGNRDIMLLNNGRCLVSVPQGFREYEIKTGKMVKEIKCNGTKIRTVVRDNRGHTFVANPTTIWEFDASDNLVNTISVKMGGFLRLLRLAKNGNFLFTGGKTNMKEADRSGTIVRKLDLAKLAPKVKKPYFMEQCEDGNYLISSGYDASLIIVDQNDTLVKKIGGRGTLSDITLDFFGDAEKLSNGNYIAANWTGHKPDDSYKAPQILEFDNSGEIVWKWHDPKRAGSIHGIAVIK